MPEWDGAERREPSVFALVEQAAEVAAQKVAAIHRRRLVTQSFLAALAVAALVSVGVMLLSQESNREAARSNAVFNCQQGKQYATVITDFVQSDQQLRFRQAHYAQRARVIGAFAKIIEPKLLKELTQRSDRLEAQTTAYWRDSILPRLDRLVSVNCDAVISKSGARTDAAPVPLHTTSQPSK